MTYYLARDREDEMRVRVEYLYRVFHTHFLRCADIGDFLCLKSFPFQDDGICFVTAHNNQAHALLSTELAAETVVLNSCFPKQFKDFVGKYRIYFCKVEISGYKIIKDFEFIFFQVILSYADIFNRRKFS